MRARDVGGAIALAEGAVAQRVLIAASGIELPAHNAFGEPVAVERGEDVHALVRRLSEAAAAGERVALVAGADDLAAARAELLAIAHRRQSVIVHCVADAGPPGGHGGSGLDAALSLADLPWGMLVPSGVSEALDLSLVARRAAEDSGCPFFVVHERGPAHHVEALAPPAREMCTAFVGAARPGSAPGDAHAVAARVPFALSAALRDLEALTARRHDVVERAPNVDAALALVGMGPVGDALVAEAERLRGHGQDVTALRIVAFRPFPGARIVKALARTLAVSVVESLERPLSPGGPLALEVKAAFSDALTWAPGFPGIGRIPRIASGALHAGRRLEATDVDAIVDNMLADERGARTFVLGGGDGRGLPSPAAMRRGTTSGFAMLGVTSSRVVAMAAADLCAAVLASTLGARTRVSVHARPDEDGGGFALDLLASRDRPRGSHAPHTAKVVAVEDAALLARGNPLARLADDALVALPSAARSAEALWAEVPPWAKAVAHDHAARVVGFRPGGPDDSPWLAAAAFAGIALAGAAADPVLGRGRRVDGAVVAREVAEALRRAGGEAETRADEGGERARATFEAPVEVPRATIERDDDGVRLGRRDARSLS